MDNRLEDEDVRNIEIVYNFFDQRGAEKGNSDKWWEEGIVKEDTRVIQGVLRVDII